MTRPGKLARRSATVAGSGSLHGPTIQEAQLTIADHYGSGWLAGQRSVPIVPPIQIQPGFTLTAVGLTITGRPSFKSWSTAGEILRHLHRSVPYAWGAWLVYGESREDWSERMSQALEGSGYERQTLLNLAYVTRHVEAPELELAPSVSHAAEVASLTRSDQTKWLTEARTEGWTTRELRSAIRTAASATILDGRAETMHTVIVEVSLDVEASSSHMAQEVAWEAIKTALSGPFRGRAKVIGAKAMP